jgi:DNA helicase HerA-like ATPase
LAGIPYPEHAETRHTLITGTTGAGKKFLSKEKYLELVRDKAFDLVYDENEIALCFRNALKIFTIVCMKGSEFISDYVRQNFLEAENEKNKTVVCGDVRIRHCRRYGN